MVPRADRRPDPDHLLRQVEAEEHHGVHSKLKVFLGYASGTGKSFRMLDEGRRRFERGQDVVVGAVQDRMEPAAQAVLEHLERIPPSMAGGAPAMDVDAILRRHPQVCLIDGLAYDNPPGSRNRHRWQDVNDMLMSGISVIASVNVQYIDEYRDRVEEITGKRATQSVPVAFLQTAAEIVVVDAPPEFAMEKARTSSARVSIEQLENGLSQLRELALLIAADVVDRQLSETLACQGLARTFGAQERIMVCLTPRTSAEKLLTSARRNVERFHGELFAVYVTQPETSPEDSAALERNIALARDAGARIEILDAVDPVDAILDFARSRSITQIYVGHSASRRGWLSRLASTPVDRLLERADNMDVRVFPH